MDQEDLPFPGPGEKFTSEDQANEVLAAVRAEFLLTKAYPVAVELCAKRGSVYGTLIWQTLERRGALTDEEKLFDRRCMSVVFVGKDFKDTWQAIDTIKVGNTATNYHASPSTLWTFSDAYKGRAKPFEHRVDSLTPGELTMILSRMHELFGEHAKTPLFVKLGQYLRTQLEDTKG